ncbi:YjjG family noncanonical pyrimidine nucleotidase [Enterococcus sp. HY326]|uniref:YjjG family noncanonical pyrimidine nucleotidase n=1 Tax=Enterococcus sp. HY326 TaxID=2971265 RepID=UPI0022404813|nr:YjjG family noncanonical pyrimidine nucleotidase [Enterococcus sp. HY326]
MRYNTLLFDVDDTLLDFQATEKQALTKLFATEGLTLSPDLEEQYKTMNHGLWAAFERGGKTRDEVVNQRFGIFFEALGVRVDSVELENRYRKFLEEGHDLLGNSYQIVADLSTKADLYVVTNGVSQTQYRRLTDARLLPFFKEIFVSEDTGYQKPMKEYFDYVFARIPNLDKSDTVIIGDSLSSDIKGGIVAGIDTIWLNSKSEQASNEIHPTYTINQLESIYRILEN